MHPTMPDLSAGLCVRAVDKSPWIGPPSPGNSTPPGFVHPACEGCPVLDQCQSYAAAFTWHGSVVVGGWLPRARYDRRVYKGGTFIPPWRDNDEARPAQLLRGRARADWERRVLESRALYEGKIDMQPAATCAMCSKPPTVAYRAPAGWWATCDDHVIDYATWKVIAALFSPSKTVEHALDAA